MIGRRHFVRNVFAALAMAPAARAFAETSGIEAVPMVYDSALKATLPKGAEIGRAHV